MSELSVGAVMLELEAAYREIAQDEESEAEALEWAEATIRDVSDEEERWDREAGQV